MYEGREGLVKTDTTVIPLEEIDSQKAEKTEDL